VCVQTNQQAYITQKDKLPTRQDKTRKRKRKKRKNKEKSSAQVIVVISNIRLISVFIAPPLISTYLFKIHLGSIYFLCNKMNMSLLIFEAKAPEIE
jgi:hypothetical protein